MNQLIDENEEHEGLLPSMSHFRKGRRTAAIMLMMLSLALLFRLPSTSHYFNNNELATNPSLHNSALDNNTLHNSALDNSTTTDDLPTSVQVFLLAGQSNMVGFGSVQHLQSLVQSGNYTHLMKNGQWVVRSRVRVVLPSEESPLTVGLGFNQSYFGPELGFGWTVSERLHQNTVIIIKAAWDGYSLAVNFRPPSAGMGNYSNYRHQQLGEEKYGAAYRQMMDMVNETLSKLSTPYQFKGFVWFQGWADQNPQKSAEYKSNLVHLIQDVRSAVGVPDLPVVIGECGQYRGKLKDQELLQRVRDAQKAVTEVFPETSKLVDARIFTHENRTESYNAGFHYHGHADTYYEIGAAFGSAMLELMGV